MKRKSLLIQVKDSIDEHATLIIWILIALLSILSSIVYYKITNEFHNFFKVFFE